MSSAEELEKYRDRLAGLLPPEAFKVVEFDRPSKQLIERLSQIEGITCAVSDALDKLGVNGAVSATTVRPATPGARIVGPAVTILYVPRVETATYCLEHGLPTGLACREAYAISQPGDVIIMDNSGRDISTLGGLSASIALKAGISGFIVWGGVRDVAELREMGCRVWSKCVTPFSGKFRAKTVAINSTVTVAGIAVEPGDLVVADDTGTVFVPRKYIDEVAKLVIQQDDNEKSLVDAIRSGASASQLNRVLPPDKW